MSNNNLVPYDFYCQHCDWLKYVIVMLLESECSALM